jgi:hypothetical protein
MNIVGYTTKTIGNDTDLWNYAWTPAEINSNAFGFGLRVFNTGFTSATADVRNIKATVYYGEGPDITSSFQYRCAEVENLEFEGCQMTSPDFNIASPDTVDGGPVVEIIDANPNQIIVQTGGVGGTLGISNR